MHVSGAGGSGHQGDAGAAKGVLDVAGGGGYAREIIEDVAAGAKAGGRASGFFFGFAAVLTRDHHQHAVSRFRATRLEISLCDRVPSLTSAVLQVQLAASSTTSHAAAAALVEEWKKECA